MVHTLQTSLKKKIFADREAVDRGFRFFDRGGGGECNYDDFREGVKALGLPLKKPQIVRLFNDFDDDGGD